MLVILHLPLRCLRLANHLIIVPIGKVLIVFRYYGNQATKTLQKRENIYCEDTVQCLVSLRDSIGKNSNTMYVLFCCQSMQSPIFLYVNIVIRQNLGILAWWLYWNCIQTFFVYFKGRIFFSKNEYNTKHLNVNLKVGQIRLLKQQGNSVQASIASHCKTLTSDGSFPEPGQQYVSLRDWENKESREALPLHLSVCASQPFWEVINSCRPFAHELSRHSRKQRPLLLLSVNMTHHISVKKGQKPWWHQPHMDRMLHHDEPGRSQRQRQACRQPNALKDARINSTFPPKGLWVNRILTHF